MPAFKFNLQRVLDIRDAQERIRKNELALERKKEQEILQRIEQLHQEQTDSYRSGASVMSSGQADIRIFLSYQRYMEYIERTISKTREMLEEQKKAVELSRQMLIEASRKKKLLEKIKEKRWQAFKKVEAAAEQMIIDEIGGTQYIPPQAQDPGMEAGGMRA